MQLDIFSIVPDCSIRELPIAVRPVEPKVEKAIAVLVELKEISRSQFQVGSRVIAGKLSGVISKIESEDLCQVLFDSEKMSRSAFLDYLEIEVIEAESNQLSEGCLVRSPLFFKGKTGKVISLENISTITMATVEIEFRGKLIRFPCGTKGLEVVS